MSGLSNKKGEHMYKSEFFQEAEEMLKQNEIRVWACDEYCVED